MMVCRDAGSRDLTSHVATLQCCMLHAAVCHHQAPAGGSASGHCSRWWPVELDDILEKSAQSLMNVHLLVEI